MITAAQEKFVILRNFEFSHLSEKLQDISRPFCELANQVAERSMINRHGIHAAENSRNETEMALRKLLEAKDCAVRAALASYF